MNVEKTKAELQLIVQKQQQLLLQLGLNLYNFLDSSLNLKGQIADTEVKRKKLAKKLPKEPEIEAPKK